MNNIHTITVKKLVPGLKDIEQAHEGEWIDLRCAEDISLKPGEYCEIPLGVAIMLPFNFEAIVAARSSTFKKWGVIPVGGIGVIDNKYCGENDEWKFPVIAMRHTKIHKNDRICQFKLMLSQNWNNEDIVYVDSLGTINRGGLGSTGKD